MRKHIFGFLFFILTFGFACFLVPRAFYESGRGAVGYEEQLCSARTFYSGFGEKVVLWSCTAISDFRSPQEEFEFSVTKYTTISRSNSRAVVSYGTGQFRGFCVLRLDGNWRNDICSITLEPILDFEQRYLGESNN